MLQRVIVKGKPAYRFGDTGKAFTYTAGDVASRKRAKTKATKQGAVVTKPAAVAAGRVKTVKTKVRKLKGGTAKSKTAKK